MVHSWLVFWLLGYWHNRSRVHHTEYAASVQENAVSYQNFVQSSGKMLPPEWSNLDSQILHRHSVRVPLADALLIGPVKRGKDW